MALNKPNKRLTAATLPRVGVALFPNPNAQVELAGRRAACGCYWGFLDTGLALGNSGKYVDAKTLYQGEDRNFLNVLPRNILWTIIANLSVANDRKDVLDTGFYAIPCGSINELDDPVGTSDLGTYIKNNAGLPLSLKTANNLGAHVNDFPPNTLTIFPCWSSSGSFIGNNVPGCAPDLSPTKFRFRNSGGTPAGQTYIDYNRTFDIFRIPIFPSTALDKNGSAVGSSGETITLWELSEDSTWLLHTTRAKTLVDALAASPYFIDVTSPTRTVGLTLDYEDYVKDSRDTSTQNGGAEPTTKALYDADPRFATASRALEVELLYYTYLGAMLDARMKRLADTQATWAKELYSLLYDYDYRWAGDPAQTRFTKAYGRNRFSLIVYSYTTTPDTFRENMIRLGQFVFWTNNKRPYAAQIFDFWFSASLQNVTDPKVPSGDHWLTIAQSVMMIKCAMCLGALRVAYYTESTQPAHPYFSAAVAYEETQPFADIIKNGTNYIPPGAINRHQTNPYLITPFYQKNASDIDIDANTFVCCRFYQNQMLFFAGTTDGVTRLVQVRAPDGSQANLTATAYGNVTIVKG